MWFADKFVFYKTIYQSGWHLGGCKGPNFPKWLAPLARVRSAGVASVAKQGGRRKRTSTIRSAEQPGERTLKNRPKFL